MKSKLISEKEFYSIIESEEPYEPKGLFYFKSDDKYIGIDNSTGNAWTEEFYSETLCKAWLENEILEKDQVQLIDEILFEKKNKKVVK